MNLPARLTVRLCLSLLVVGVGASSLAACASNADTSGGPNAFADSGAVAAARQSCTRTADCFNRNEVCGRPGSEAAGMCIPPSGTCDPEAPIEGQCYPDARCDVSIRMPGGRGSCSFQSPARAVFPVERRIALEAPNAATELLAQSGFSFQWQPLRGVAGAVTVVMAATAPPNFDPVTGRIVNRADVVWAWSTAETGNTAGDSRAVDGTVPVRFGHRGVNRDGSFGASWGTNTLPAGPYWWFVYAISQGEVVATSVAQGFVVAASPTRPRSCARSAECVGPGDLPELFECYQSQCRRRCASDLDCRAEGTVCRFDDTVVADSGVRRGAFCATTPTLMPSDAGVSGDGPR